MKAVWSFWSKPYYRRPDLWLSERYHLLSWVLSVGTAREHFRELELVTDEAGARMLVDDLGLEFTSVSTALSGLDDADPSWWTLGKLWAYSSQRTPFVHIDNDVFLWKPLPQRLLTASVFTQNPEMFPFEDDSWYRPLYFDDVIRAVNGWVPDEWRSYVGRRANRAACCGILGGTAVPFISHYASQAIRMIEHDDNRAAWRLIGNPVNDNILLEQYLLSACVEHHRGKPGSVFRDVEMRYLLPSAAAAFNERWAACAGYTHLIGGAKRNEKLLERLEHRVRRDYPGYYERCVELAPDLVLASTA